MTWCAVVLAASRGKDDPMAKAFGVLHKCRIPVAGTPMIVRVVDALRQSGCISSVAVSTESEEVFRDIIANSDVVHSPSQASAPASALYAISEGCTYPVLITTGDHALLTSEMVRHVCDTASRLDADFSVGLATAETILGAYPETRRTFFRFGNDRVSGCNLFTVHSAAGLRVLERWRYMEQNRKKPWKLVFSFGFWPLLRFVTHRLSLQQAFYTVSAQLGVRVRPLLLPFAEAAIDVDKPADKELAEAIIKKRETR